MMKDRFKIRFKYYKNSDPIQGISYKVSFNQNPNGSFSPRYYYKEHEGKISNALGETVEFIAPSDYGKVVISVKGKSNKYKDWTIVKSAIWDERNDDYKLKTIQTSVLREIEIELPLINAKVKTKTKENNGNHKSDYYQVKEGETLANIAKRFKINISTLMENNDIRDASKIRTGQKINISNKKNTDIQIFKPQKQYFIRIDYIVNVGDTIESIAKRYSLIAKNIMNDNDLKSANNLKAGTKLKLINHSAKLFFRDDVAKLTYDLTLKGYPVTSFKAEFTRQIEVSIGATVWDFLGSSFGLGIAWDQRGNWMLYYSSSASGNLDKKAANLHDGDKKKVSNELSFSLSGSNVRSNAKHISELAGADTSFSNTVNVGAYEAGFVNVESDAKDIDTGETKIVRGRGGKSSFEIGNKKVKSELIPNAKAEKGLSITIPIYILETGKLKKNPSSFK